MDVISISYHQNKTFCFELSFDGDVCLSLCDFTCLLVLSLMLVSKSHSFFFGPPALSSLGDVSDLRRLMSALAQKSSLLPQPLVLSPSSSSPATSRGGRGRKRPSRHGNRENLTSSLQLPNRKVISCRLFHHSILLHLVFFCSKIVFKPAVSVTLIFIFAFFADASTAAHRQNLTLPLNSKSCYPYNLVPGGSLYSKLSGSLQSIASVKCSSPFVL